MGRAGTEAADSWSCSRCTIPLCPVMPKYHIETFRAPTMIMGTFGSYLAISVRDHENGPGRAAPVRSDVATHRLVAPRPRRGEHANSATIRPARRLTIEVVVNL
jgi:hypothetical protein